MRRGRVEGVGRLREIRDRRALGRNIRVERCCCCGRAGRNRNYRLGGPVVFRGKVYRPAPAGLD